MVMFAGCASEGSVDDSVPDLPYCDPVSDWDPAWTAFEDDVLAQVNQARSQGHNCDSEGNFGATAALTMSPALRCAARVHSMDMSVRNFFDHTNPSNESPWDRMAAAGYSFSRAGENIAAGQADPDSVMQSWLDSDGHCANIMNPDFTEIGVGFYPDSGPYWTQALGTPSGGQ